MKTCRKCGLLQKDCECKAKVVIPTSAPCQLCGEVHVVSYLRAYNNLEVCADCLSIEQMEPADREYYRTLAAEYKVPLVDIPVHLKAANIKSMRLEEYLASLPRSREEFREYFKNGITIGGVKL